MRFYILFLSSILFTIFSVCCGTMVGGRKTFSPDEIHAWLKEELSTENNKHKTFGQVLGTAAVQYNKMTNSMYLHTFDAEKDIVKVQSQVVQGTMYYVTVNMHPTECRKTEENLTEDGLLDCQIQHGGNSQNVLFELWYRSWLSGGDELKIEVVPVMENAV